MAEEHFLVLMEVMMDEMPLRSILMMGDGALTREVLDGLLIMINGKFFSGAGALIKGIFNK